MWSSTLNAQLIFPSKPNFCNLFDFPATLLNPLKNKYLPHLSSENCEINSIKSDLLRAFQQHQERPKFQCSFPFWFYLVFAEKTVQQSIASTPKLQTVSNQVSTPLLIESVPKIPRAQHEALWVRRSQRDKQGVTNTLALPVDKMLYLCIYVCIQIHILLCILFACIIT